MNIDNFILANSDFKYELESAFYVLQELYYNSFNESEFIECVKWCNKCGTTYTTDIVKSYDDYQIVYEILINHNVYYYSIESINDLKNFIVTLYNNNILEYWSYQELIDVLERRAGNEWILNIIGIMTDNLLFELMDNDIYYKNPSRFGAAFLYCEKEYYDISDDYKQFIKYYKQFKDYYKINIPLSDEYIKECFYDD